MVGLLIGVADAGRRHARAALIGASRPPSDFTVRFL